MRRAAERAAAAAVEHAASAPPPPPPTPPSRAHAEGNATIQTERPSETERRASRAAAASLYATVQRFRKYVRGSESNCE